MGITLKGGLMAKAQLGLSKNLNAMMSRLSALRVNTFHESIAIGMFTSQYLPYEASQTYRTIKAEFEYQRSRALVEVHLQTCRQ